MTKQNLPSYAEFEAGLGRSNITALRVFYIISFGQAFVFLILVLYLAFTYEAPYAPEPDSDVKDELLFGVFILHLVFAAIGMPLAFWIRSAGFKQSRLVVWLLGALLARGASAARYFGFLLGIHLVGLFTLNALAFLGLIACLIGVMSGTIHFLSHYWLNGLSAVILLIFIAVKLPSRDRLLTEAKNHLEAV